MYKNINDYEVLYMVSDNDSDNVDMLINKYRPLIVNIALRYLNKCSTYGIELDDLIQIGSIAVYDAMRTYIDDNNTLFYTYVSRIIERKFNTLLRDNNTKKQLTLNTCIYLEDKMPDSKLSYFDTIKDDSITMDDYLYYKDLYINFCNDLSFNDSLIFILLTNGFNYEETGILLDININYIRKRYYIIKNKLYSMNC